MRYLCALVLLLAYPCIVHAQTTPPASGADLKSALAAAKSAAKVSANSWLAVIDSGDYGKSWDQASDTFQAAVTRAAWISQAQSVLGPLGKLELRALKSAYFTELLPNAPDGEYILIEYDSSFEKEKTATETIIMTQEPDGSWKTDGYFVSPKAAGS